MVSRVRLFIIVGIVLLCGVLYSVGMAYRKGLDVARNECINQQNDRVLQDVGVRDRIEREVAKKATKEKREALKKYVIQ